MTFLIYVLHSKDSDSIYIGMSNDPERRLREQNSGQNKSTKAYLPWVKYVII
ncbi:MAG: putative endonuclease [Polaribacter sp.]|jgi:putative endonuclease